MDIIEPLSLCRPDTDLDKEVGPEDMHAVEHEGHKQQISVLEADDVPLVLRGRLVGVHIRQETERKDYDSQVDPCSSHGNIDE